MTVRVGPLPEQPPRPTTTDGLCGHWALGYVTCRSLPRVIADTGHQRPLSLREIVAELRAAGTIPMVVHQDALRTEGRDLWYAYGEDSFLAICCDLDLADESSVGHAVVVHGRRMYDPANPSQHTRFTADMLAKYSCAIICMRGRA